MQFAYIAHDLKGKEERGRIAAASPEEARELLRKRELLVEEIHAEKDAAPPKRPVQFATPMPAPARPNPGPKKSAWKPLEAEAAVHDYLPLIDTFRLFAGWLLAWYALVYLFGSAAYFDRLPFSLPFVDSLYLSPLILRFTFATFLFLMLTTVHKALRGGIAKGLALTFLGIALFVLFHVNVP